jgi:hypothetical protein
VQRLDVRLERHHHDLQKTVASGGVSQILEVQRQPCKVTHANAENPKQPCFPGDLRRLQAGMPQLQNNLSPFALCRKLLINASRSAYNELLQMQATA